MKSFWNALHKIGDFLHLPDLPTWLLGILVLVLILRVPSFFEPYYYGDEMIYLTLGHGVTQGLTLYKDIYDNKPPLLYITAAIAGNLFWFKVILAAWNILTIIIFYKLAEVLFQKRKWSVKLAALFFALITTLPIFEGLTVNSELFMIGFTILAFLILLKEKLATKNIFFAGVLLGLGTLFKVPAAFDAPVIVFYWLMTEGFANWKVVLKRTLILVVGFLVPIVLTVIYYFFKGALPDFLKATFLQNITYLSSYRPGDIQKPFLLKNAPLLIRASIVFVGFIIIYVVRKKTSSRFILLLIWMLLSLFAITLSERPYPHYFIQAAAPVSFLLAMLFTERSIEQAFTVIPLAIAFFIPFHYNFYQYQVVPYYVRFINFVSGKMDRNTYLQSFDTNTIRNYQISDFLIKSSGPSDRVFIWDPASPTIYALSRRIPPVKYVVPYHVYDYSNTKELAQNLNKNLPRFIITSIRYPYPEIASIVKSDYLLIQQIDDVNIYIRHQLQ